MKKVLIIAAHPDDEVIGCGGTIARLAREGNDVTIVILGEGITSRYLERNQADSSLLKTLKSNSRKVAELLGAKDLFMYNFPDNRFDTIPLLDIVKIIEKHIHDIRPQVIYTQHGGDLNIDHAITYRATLTAARPLSINQIKMVYAFEAPSSTEWAFQTFSPVFKPNVFMDISDTIGLKMKAMQLYETETRPSPHPRSEESLKALMQHRGSASGLEAAEAFELVWSIQ